MVERCSLRTRSGGGGGATGDGASLDGTSATPRPQLQEAACDSRCWQPGIDPGGAHVGGMEPGPEVVKRHIDAIGISAATPSDNAGPNLG